MEGTRLSHYEVLERLGGGGMGVVYKALDTRLNRHVALKFLPRELTRDDEARQRFIQEAQAASALDHPNICTIHEIDATPDGQMFIAMAFYDGETLKKRIERGSMSVESALDVAGQIAQGLQKAHAAGIVHRDIKPANVIVTQDGFVKILDFGIAKLLGVTGPTQTGSTLGTVSYMSPEQIAGDDADPRSDVWALGAVLYEMLTGRLPFRGESQWAVMNAIANRDPEPPRAFRPELPSEVETVVLHALEKSRERRTPSADELAMVLQACLAPRPAGMGARGASPWRAIARPTVAVPLATVAVVVAAWAVVTTGRTRNERWAREEALPSVLALLEQDDYAGAFALANDIDRLIPSDPVLLEAMEEASVRGAIVTVPDGADVFVRTYADTTAEWRLLGRSPIENVRLARSSAIQLRIEKEGFEPRTIASGVPGFYFGRGGAEPITLSAIGAHPPEMVLVPAGDYPVRITGFDSGARVHLDAFLIDRYEVTNADYQEFVDAGAYRRPELWEGLAFVKDGRALSWEEAMAEFVDATGQPGPASWANGHFPEAEADYPVGGVSWYEAASYLRFKGKSLPTIYHWARAALESHSNSTPLSTAMIPVANFGGDGPRPVGSSGAMGPHGTLDTAGNVKEWCWNASGDHQWLLGGAWDDDNRMHSVRFTSPPFDRSTRHGFRGVRYLTEGALPAEIAGPVDLLPQDYRNARAVSDEIFEVYRRQMAYVPSELGAVTESVDDTAEDWVVERVTFDAGYEDERVSLYLYLPKSAAPPYQAIVLFYGLGPFQTRPPAPSSVLMRAAVPPLYSDLVRAGRALVVPIWNGSFERWDDFLSLSGDQYLRAFRTRMAEWAADLGHTLDYLESRGDFGPVIYTGSSFGASTTLALLGLEPRLSGALLLLPGFTYRDLPPEADAVNYVPRITMPILMIGGRYDYVFPVETSQRPLYDQLGTPAADKRFLLYEMGHGPFPRGQFLRDALPWLDERLGPVTPPR